MAYKIQFRMDESFQYNRLEKFLSTKTDNGNPRQRILGDYQQLKAWGNTFCGVFAGNGVPFGRPVRQY